MKKSSRGKFQESFIPNYKNTSKLLGKPKSDMPGGANTIGEGMLTGKSKLKINNPKGKNEGKRIKPKKKGKK